VGPVEAWTKKLVHAPEKHGDAGSSGGSVARQNSPTVTSSLTRANRSSSDEPCVFGNEQARIRQFPRWAARDTVLEGVSNRQTIRPKLKLVIDKSPSKSATASFSPSFENDIAARRSECPRISATSFAVPWSENKPEISRMRIELSATASATVVPSGLRAASIVLSAGPKPIVRKSQIGTESFGKRLASSIVRIRATLPPRRRNSSVVPSSDNSTSASENPRGLAKSTLDSRAVLSLDDVTRRIPSGLNAALSTGAPWSVTVAIARPDASSHNRAVLSEDAVTIRAPSGLKAAELTLFSCPLNVATSRPDAASHKRAVLAGFNMTVQRAIGNGRSSRRLESTDIVL
jgi:hypothetical protein